MVRLFSVFCLSLFLAGPFMAAGGDDSPELGGTPGTTPAARLQKPPPTIPEEILRSRPPPPPANRPDDGMLREQLEQLDSFLQLSPEKLQRMRQTIEMIERMGEEERLVLRMQIRQFTEVSPEIKEEIGRMSKPLPPEYHTLFNQYWLSLYPDQRSQLKEEMDALSAAEREPYLVARLDRFRARIDAMLVEMKRRAEQPKTAAE